MTHTFKLSRRTARLRPLSLVGALLLAGGCDSTESLAPTAAEFDVQPSFAVTSSSISISNITASSKKAYSVVWGLKGGSKIYLDRAYTFTSAIPTALAGLPYIQTANDDKNTSAGSTSFLSFDISTDATVYVGHDNRLARPAWLSSNFQDTGFDLVSSDGESRYSVFKRSYARGRVTLGSNVKATGVSVQSMYVVMVEPKVAPAPTLPTETPPPAVTGSGIPFGYFHLPNEAFGSSYDGALRNIWAEYLLTNLATIKARGGKVMLNMAGHEKYYKDANGHFSLTKWKARIDLFKRVNFASYITDGTVIGHYLIDEPNDPANWNGEPIPGSMLEEMAKYSKSIWPNMATVVRAYPDYVDNWTGTYQYLDAAWAQYVYRKGDVNTFITQNVALAKAKGLALIVGLNVIKGGPDGVAMTASQVKSWGTALLSSSYPCAFLSWQYEDGYAAKSDVKTSMAALRDLAKNRTAKSCHGS